MLLSSYRSIKCHSPKDFNIQQDRPCTYNVTLTGLRATIFAAENNECYTTSVCVFVALGIQRVMLMRHIVICGLPSSTVFFHIIS